MAYLEHTAAFAKKHLEIKDKSIKPTQQEEPLSNSDMNSQLDSAVEKFLGGF
jgi:hypothetical protein